MSQIERLYKLKSYLDAGRCLTRRFLLEDLGTGPSSLKRDIAHLRNRMGAPIVFDRERGGWRLDQQAVQAGAGLQQACPTVFRRSGRQASMGDSHSRCERLSPIDPGEQSNA